VYALWLPAMSLPTYNNNNNTVLSLRWQHDP